MAQLFKRDGSPARRRGWSESLGRKSTVSKYRQPFLSALKEKWASRFPDWRPGICAPVYWARSDCTFTRDSTQSSTGPRFHAVVNFTPKTPGRVTADIVVTPSLDRLPDQDIRRFSEDIPALRIGSYRIGHFGAGRDRWWRLADDAADPHASGILLQRHAHDWYASSYSLPLAEIVRQAVDDFSDTFERDVIPKLKPNQASEPMPLKRHGSP